MFTDTLVALLSKINHHIKIGSAHFSFFRHPYAELSLI